MVGDGMKWIARIEVQSRPVTRRLRETVMQAVGVRHMVAGDRPGGVLFTVRLDSPGAVAALHRAIGEAEHAAGAAGFGIEAILSVRVDLDDE